MKNNKEYDVIIAGSGLAGLFAALNLPESYKILIVTKDTADLSDSFLAQGGICVQRDDDDYDSFMEDTLSRGCDDSGIQRGHPGFAVSRG